MSTVVVLGTAAAGIALAGGSDAPGGTLAALAGSASAVAPVSAVTEAVQSDPAGPAAAAAPMVTVPALTTIPATAPAGPAVGSTAVPPAAPAAPAAPPATAEPAAPPDSAAPADPAVPAAPAEPAAPAPAPPAPADVPVVAPYATVIGWHGEAPVAYLTFDDGPGPATGRVLDILAVNGVQATFCQIGQRVAEAPDLTRRVVAEGHTLCNHSWNHQSPFDTLSPADIDGQIGRTQDAFIAAVGSGARYFRAPDGAFGATGGTVLQAAQRARTIPLGWGVDSLDWRRPGVDAIVANILATVSPGAVILLHDGGGTDREQTLAALPGIIAGLRAAGYTLAAMPPDPAG